MRQRGAVCVMVLPQEIHVRRYFFWCGDVQWLGDRCCRRRTEEGSVGYGRRGTALYLHCDPPVSVIHFYFSPICYLACSVMAISHSWTCTEIGARSRSCSLDLHIYLDVYWIFNLFFWSYFPYMNI
jgi:hypothetical protein